MARVLLLGPARQAAGASTTTSAAATVDELRVELAQRYGPEFAALLGSARIWVDGKPVSGADHLPADAEVSVLPPVSGG